MKQEDNRRLLSRSEVEDQFGIPKRFLEVAVAKGDGPKLIRIGRLVRYRIKDIEAWIEEKVSPEGAR